MKYLGYLVLVLFCALSVPLCAAEKPMVVIIPSYNNEQYCIKNLVSIFTQEYSNYRVIYIDDCSSDATYGLVKQYVDDHGYGSRTTLIRNAERRGAMENLYNAIWSCNDWEVVVTVDGDDALSRSDALTILNEVYTHEDVLLTYGQFAEDPSGNIGFCQDFPTEVIEHNSFREFNGCPVSHVRTFYAWLFKQIKREDLLYQGKFYPMTWDKAMMIPMLEMSGGRFKCIPTVLYSYNYVNPINDHKVDNTLQTTLAQEIYAKERYLPLVDEQLAAAGFVNSGIRVPFRGMHEVTAAQSIEPFFMPFQNTSKKLSFFGQYYEDEYRKLVASVMAPHERMVYLYPRAGYALDTYVAQGGTIVCCDPRISHISRLQERYSGANNMSYDIRFVGASSDTEGSVVSSAQHTQQSQQPGFKKFMITTLDDLIAQYGLPNYCKIGAQGYSLEALKGLSSRIPWLSLEFNAQMLDELYACIDRLVELGYNKFNLTPGERGWFFFERWLDGDAVKVELAVLAELPLWQESTGIWGDLYATGYGDAALNVLPAATIGSVLADFSRLLGQ